MSPISKETNLCVLPFGGFYQTIHDVHLDEWYDWENEPSGGEVKAYCNSYARAYTEAFCDEYQISGLFESLESNKNGIGERIFIDLPVSELKRIWKGLDRQVLARTLKDLYTTRPGFIPYYENTIDAWLDKAGTMEEWDHNECYTVLLAYARQNGFDSEQEIFLGQAASEKVI
jgi:hypothetical protein